MRRPRSPRGLARLACLAVAVAVHAALLLPVRSRTIAPEPPPDSLTIIDMDPTVDTPADDAVTRTVQAPDTAKAEGASGTVERRMAMSTARSSEAAREPSAGQAPSIPGAEPRSPDESPDQRGDESGRWTLQAEQPADYTSPGVIARAARGLEGDAPPTGEIAGGVSTTGGVAEGLDAHDFAIGMGRGGPVVTAIESAAAGEDAPFEGAATFDVAIHTDGHVSVALLDAASGTEEWSKVGEATRRALDPKRVRIPPGARGWHVVVRVEAKVQYPNGLDPKKLGTTLAASPTGISLASAGKVCSVRLTLGLTLAPIMGGCDPANIGARPLRVVHGHTVNEGRL